MLLSWHLSNVNISADTLSFILCLRWSHVPRLFEKVLLLTRKKKNENYKMPAMHFPSSFPPALCFPLPPSLPLIDQWQNLGDVCFIKCLTVFLFLLAKQGIWMGQSCHPSSLSVVLHVSPAMKKSLICGNFMIHWLWLLNSNTHLCLPVVISVR